MSSGAPRLEALDRRLLPLRRAAIVIPFWLGLVPIYVTLRDLHLTGTYLGDDRAERRADAAELTVFLYTGFIRMLPEGARGGGAGRRGRVVSHPVPRGRAAAARARSPARSPSSPACSAGTTSSSPLIFLNGSEPDAAAGRRLPVRRGVRLPVEPHLRRRRRLARCRSWSSTSSSSAAGPGVRRREQDVTGVRWRRSPSPTWARPIPDGTRAVSGPRPRDRGRRVRGVRRAIGLRQDDGAADGRRARGDHRRRAPDRRRRRQRPRAAATATSRWSSRTTRSTRT